MSARRQRGSVHMVDELEAVADYIMTVDSALAGVTEDAGPMRTVLLDAHRRLRSVIESEISSSWTNAEARAQSSAGGE